MIGGVSDFYLTDVEAFEDFLTDFTSYPDRADAASGMPFDSLADLDGLLDPPLKCLDPAWLTESVRQIDWFRTNGFVINSRTGELAPQTATDIPGEDPPPVVTKDFLEDAHDRVRRWARAWEGGCPTGVVADENQLPTNGWQSLGAISLEWDETDGAYEIIPDAGAYTVPEGVDLDPVVSYRRELAKAAIRDFLSIRLFDHEMPDDDLSIPEFTWTEADDGLEDEKTGVSVKLLSRQLLALHSDCEKSKTLICPFGLTQNASDAYDIKNRRTGQQESNARYKSHDYCTDGCGTVHTGEGGQTSLDQDNSTTGTPAAIGKDTCPPSRVPVATGAPSGFPQRYSRTVEHDAISWPIDGCHPVDPCEINRYAVREFWDLRTDSTQEIEWKQLPDKIEYSYTPPEWAEIEDAWLILVASSRKLASSYKTETYLTDTSTGTTTAHHRSTGTFKSELFFALVPASCDGSKLTVDSIPDIPEPSRGTPVEVEGQSPVGEGGEDEPNGTFCGRDRYKITEDAASIISVLGVVATVKFGASVKE